MAVAPTGLQSLVKRPSRRQLVLVRAERIIADLQRELAEAAGCHAIAAGIIAGLAGR
jgi:hypothetical protein